MAALLTMILVALAFIAWRLDRIGATLRSINVRLAEIDGELGYRGFFHQELERIERAIRDNNQAPGD